MILGKLFSPTPLEPRSISTGNIMLRNPHPQSLFVPPIYSSRSFSLLTCWHPLVEFARVQTHRRN